MTRLFQSLSFACNGIWHCVQKERNFLIQLVIALIVVIGAWVFELNTIEWVLILLNIALVVGFEMMNTSIERICNFVHPQHNSLIKVIKDVAAGAVLIVSILAAICGVLIFLPKIFSA